MTNYKANAGLSYWRFLTLKHRQLRWLFAATGLFVSTIAYGKQSVNVDGKQVSYWPSARVATYAEFQFDMKGYRNTYTLDCHGRRFLWTRNVRISTGKETKNTADAEWRPLNEKSLVANTVNRKLCPKLLSGRPSGPEPSSANLSNPSQAFLAAVLTGEEAKIPLLVQRTKARPKRKRGDRKEARAWNSRGLESLENGNTNDAVTYFFSAAKADPGDVEVIGNLGYALLVNEQPKEAKKVLALAISMAPERAASWANLGEAYAALGKKHNAVAAFRLTFLFSRNIDKTKEYLRRFMTKPESTSTLRVAAEEALTSTLISIGTQSTSTDQTEISDSRKAAELQGSAEEGDPTSQYDLGYAFLKGTVSGIEVDPTKALEWLTKAAAQNSSAAALLLANSYAEGDHFPQDYAKALEWYRVSAESGSIAARLKIGNWYLEGRGVGRDAAESEKWFKQAAAMGSSEAVHRLETIQQQRKDALAKELLEEAKRDLVSRSNMRREQSIFWKKHGNEGNDSGEFADPLELLNELNRELLSKTSLEASGDEFAPPEKGEFEKTAEYTKRIEHERHTYEEKHRIAMLQFQKARPKIRQEIVNRYFGDPSIEKIAYDADREIFAVVLRSDRAGYDITVEFAHPIDTAPSLKKEIISWERVVLMSLDDGLLQAQAVGFVSGDRVVHAAITAQSSLPFRFGAQALDEWERTLERKEEEKRLAIAEENDRRRALEEQQRAEKIRKYGHSGRFVSAGSLMCLEFRSALKASVLVRMNNPYVSLPADCIASTPGLIAITDVQNTNGNLARVTVKNTGDYAFVPSHAIEE